LGEEPTAQFWRLGRKLGTQSIASRSPRAIGRIEGRFKTFKARLVNEYPNLLMNFILRRGGIVRNRILRQVEIGYLEKALLNLL
jgi:hypothetical protein